jgi:hypothetical protein
MRRLVLAFQCLQLRTISSARPVPFSTENTKLIEDLVGRARRSRPKRFVEDFKATNAL